MWLVGATSLITILSSRDDSKGGRLGVAERGRIGGRFKDQTSAVIHPCTD